MNVFKSTHDRSPGQDDMQKVSEEVSERFKQRKKSRVQKRLTDDMEVTDSDSESNSGLASSVDEDCDSQIEESLPD